MTLSSKDFNLFKKRKKKAEKLINFEAVKFASFLTSTALAINKALKEKASQQNLLLAKKRKKEAEAARVRVITGFIGGALVGAIGALLLTPESGDSLRDKISHYFDDSLNKSNLKEMAKSAKKKAASLESKVNGST